MRKLTDVCRPVSRRRRRIGLLALGAMFSAALAAAPAAAEDAKPVKITYIIYTEAGNVFWNPGIQGVKDAAKDFNVDVDVQYGDTDPVKQNNLIEAALANRVDGIAVMFFTKKAFTENIKKARDAGIAVIGVNIDDTGTERQAYVGADFNRRDS